MKSVFCIHFFPERVCSRPKVPNDMSMNPSKEEYTIGSSFLLSCSESGTSPSGPQYYTCTDALTWDPSIPKDMHCKTGTIKEIHILDNF